MFPDIGCQIASLRRHATRPIDVLCTLLASLACFATAAALTSSHVRAADASGQVTRILQESAYGSRFGQGIERLNAFTSSNDARPEAIFATGILEVLAALETFQKTIYDHNTWTNQFASTPSLLRAWITLPGHGSGAFVPENPRAKPMTYKVLRAAIAALADDLQKAEETLSKVEPGDFKLPLAPFQIAIDLNHDGRTAPGERLFLVLTGANPRMARQLRRSDALSAVLALDAADASWLRGYCNLVMASANALLAFDFEASYETAAHHLYGNRSTSFGRLLQREAEPRRPKLEVEFELAEVRKQIATTRPTPDERRIINDDLKQLNTKLRDPNLPDAQRKDLLLQRARIWDQQRQRNRERRELRDKQRKLQAELRGQPPGGEWGMIFDAIAYLHTMSWPVVEPERLRTARRQLVNVMRINETTWDRVRAETDDDREWLPSQEQTPPFGANPLTDEIIDSWLRLTRLAEDVLEGRKLLPHPRFKRGFNLKSFMETTERFDLVLMVAGHDMAPYLEKGETVSEETWRTLTDPLGRNFMTYAAWFN